MALNADVQSLPNLAPLASPLAPMKDDEVFTEQQWNTLFALCEVFVPSILPPGSASSDKDGLRPADYEDLIAQIQPYAAKGTTREDIERYLGESVRDISGLKESLRRRFLGAVPKDDVAGLASVLSALNTTAGALLLTGGLTPVDALSVEKRSAIVRKWKDSYIGTLRKLYYTFAALAKMNYLHGSAELYGVLGFPGNGALVTERDQETFPFEFVGFEDVKEGQVGELDCDVVVVGSGPGAGAVVNRLAKAGMKCVVLEKGYHFSSRHFPMKHSDAGEHLFENFGAVTADDGSVGTAAASTFGGGGTVNWSASLQPPQFVRQQWAEDEGLPQFMTEKYQESLDYVCDKMGAARSNDHEALGKIKHNYANRLLLEGARKVGLDVKVVPQNTGGREHDCGSCHTGCPSCTKQGPANLWFPEVADKDVQFVEGCWADKVLFADDGVTATGVRCTWTSRDRKTTKDVVIKAKRVIVASGTISSPLLLKRSGVANPWVGKNFHVHPVWFMFAVMPERIDPWSGGGLLTSVVTSLRHGTGDGHGPVIEVCLGLPTQTGLPLPIGTKAADGGVIQSRIDMAKLGHTVALFSMVRDKDSGEIYADKNNPRQPRMRYTPSQRDKDQLVIGQVAAARVAYAMGAIELNACHPDIDAFVRSKNASQEINDQGFELWLKDVKTKGLSVNSEPLMFHSAHQFGTCKMSGRKERGVVDGQGKVWGYNNFWVADSSVLPTATGVNPMISTMGTADFIARGIEKEWMAEKK